MSFAVHDNPINAENEGTCFTTSKFGNAIMAALGVKATQLRLHDYNRHVRGNKHNIVACCCASCQHHLTLSQCLHKPVQLGPVRKMPSRPHIGGLLIDISGNLHVGSTPTPNAVEAFQRLVDSKIPFRLCSNSSKESSTLLEERLNSMGFNLIKAKADESDIQSQSPTDRNDQEKQWQLVWTSLGAVAQLLKEMDLKKPYLLLSPSAREEIVAKIQLLDCETGSSVTQYDSVVVGLAPSSFDYASLNVAFRIIKGETTNASSPHRAIPLIATHKAKYIQTESGLLSLGPGPFVTALEHATGVKATVVGKPTKKFFETVINNFDTEVPEFGTGRIAVIGDDIEADLGEGAVELNLWRILVKTGKYRVGDEKRANVVPPDEVFDSFASFIDNLLPGDSRSGQMDRQVVSSDSST